ncbi:MAG TPA: hypothetical protein VHX61_09605 [Rhizomicrobium sp.]|jgi:O-antigen ligase|nr:hypothetical protein [Rhizomicrobium sp.]
MMRKNLMLLWILALPFFNAPVLNNNLFDVTGLKLINLIAALAFFALLNGTRTFHVSDRLEKWALIALGIYAAFFTLAIFRSLDNIRTFHAEMPKDFGPGLSNYLLSYYLRPLFELVPFIFILKEMRSQADMESVLRAIGASILAMSCAFLVVVLILSPSALGADRDLMSATTEKYFGQHYNDMATIYFTTAPIVAFLAIRRGGIWALNLFLAAVSILLLQSRTGLIVFAAGVGSVLLIFRRVEYLAAGAGLVVVGAMAKMAPTLETLVTEGIRGSHFTIDSLLTDRTSTMWVPLIGEWVSDNNLLLFGAGRYGILTSPMWHVGRIYQAEHAHNAFIDFFLDSGIILLAGLVLTLLMLFTIAWRFGRRLHSRLYWCLLVCLFDYLMGTVTGQSFYPSYMNMLVFPIVALLINVARHGLAPQQPVPLSNGSAPVRRSLAAARGAPAPM